MPLDAIRQAGHRRDGAHLTGQPHWRSVMRRSTICAALLLSLLTFAWTASSVSPGTGSTQSGYNLPWYAVEGGGAAISTGSSHTLDAAIDQADAGAPDAGSYSLTSSVWPGIRVESPAPSGSIRPAGPPVLVVNTTDDTDDGACDAVH